MNILQSIFGKKETINFKDLVSKGAVILDVRTSEEFSSGSIQGAINLPIDRLSTIAQKVKSKDKVIITCCASGGRSAMAASVLKKEGYTNVYNGGGWQSLQKEL